MGSEVMKHTCQYFLENEFIDRNVMSVQIFSLNIRSLPKDGDELLHFLIDLNAKSDVIVLTEILSIKVSVVENDFKLELLLCIASNEIRRSWDLHL